MSKQPKKGVKTVILILVILLALGVIVVLIAGMLHYSNNTVINPAPPQVQQPIPEPPPAEPPKPEEPAPVVTELQPEIEKLPEPEPEPEPEEKVYAYAQKDENTKTLDLQVYSECAILIDAETNTVICEKNADQKIFPASMTKVMTVLVACEQITDWDDTFRMTQAIIDPLFLSDATMAGFVDGEDVRLLDLIYGAVLPSGAEATEALARYVAGSEAAYAELMNAKAAELGLTGTHFVDASGLHNEDHYTTVRDMAIILQAAMDNEICREVLSTAHYTSQATTQNPEGVYMFNKFLDRAAYQELNGAQIIAAKTGYTTQAGNCCASYGISPKGRKCFCVTAKAETSWYALYDHIALYSQYAD